MLKCIPKKRIGNIKNQTIVYNNFINTFILCLGAHDDREYCGSGNASGEDDEAFELPTAPQNGNRAQHGK
jgi:hypothetical protein